MLDVPEGAKLPRLERACFLVPASAWVYDLTLWLAFSSYACVVLRNYRLDIVHAAITDLDCVSVENLVQLAVRWEMLVYQA